MDFFVVLVVFGVQSCNMFICGFWWGFLFVVLVGFCVQSCNMFFCGFWWFWCAYGIAGAVTEQSQYTQERIIMARRAIRLLVPKLTNGEQD